MRMKSSLLLSGVLIAVSGAAGAQAPPSPATPPAQTAPPPPARASELRADAADAAAGTVAPEGTTTGQRAEPLGDKLARSDGVLCPPAGVDPEIRAPDPRDRQHAGDSAARQPRRRPHGPAEITTGLQALGVERCGFA